MRPDRICTPMIPNTMKRKVSKMTTSKIMGMDEIISSTRRRRPGMRFTVRSGLSARTCKRQRVGRVGQRSGKVSGMVRHGAFLSAS